MNVSTTLAAFVHTWNVALSNEERNRLLDLLPGTGPLSDEQEHELGLEILDWLVRTHLPAWFDLMSVLRPHAEALRGLPAVTDATARAAGDIVRAAMKAAEDATGYVIRGASMVATGAAAMEAAGYAAIKAAMVAAGHVAMEADGFVAMEAAMEAAGFVAVEAAGYGGASGYVAVGASGYAAMAATLQPTVERLQQSAAELFRRLTDQAGVWVACRK